MCVNVEHLKQLADRTANTPTEAISALLMLSTPFHISQGHVFVSVLSRVTNSLEIM